MNVHQTENQKEATLLPTPLDFARIIGKRSMIRHSTIISPLSRLEAGDWGEAEVLKALEKYGEAHWTVLQNIWLNHYGAFECDLILLTRFCCYVLEVKNYSGHFIYEDGACKMYNKKLSSNPIAQTQRAHINLKNICANFSRRVPVKGALIFIGKNNKVTIKSEVVDIEVVQSNELYEFIQSIAYEEKFFDGYPINKGLLIAHLEGFETSNPFQAEPMTEAQQQNVRKGIYCSHCGNYEVTLENKLVKCPCGMHEPRDEAIIRTICDYGVLNFDKELTTKAIVEFLDHQFSRNIIVPLLNKYFTVVKKGKYTYYINKKLPYYKLKDEFGLTEPKILYINEKDYIVLGKT